VLLQSYHWRRHTFTYISILPRFALWFLHAKPQALWGLYARALTEMFILPKVTEKLDC